MGQWLAQSRRSSGLIFIGPLLDEIQSEHLSCEPVTFIPSLRRRRRAGTEWVDSTGLRGSREGGETQSGSGAQAWHQNAKRPLPAHVKLWAENNRGPFDAIFW